MKQNIHILQAGVPKSGNYWLYKIIENLLKAGKIKKKSFIIKHPDFPKLKKMKLNHTDRAYLDVVSIKKEGTYYSIGPGVLEKIENTNRYIKNVTHVWTHSPFLKGSKDFFPGFDKIVYIIRDPRDVSLSMADYAFTGYIKRYFKTRLTNPRSYLDINLENSLTRWAKNVAGYLENREKYNIYIIFYEKLIDNPKKEIDKLANYLDININKRQLGSVTKAVTFRNMKKHSPKHLNKGVSYRWVKEFNKFQKIRSYHLAKELIDLLNYPSSEKRLDLPKVPQKISKRLVEDALQKIINRRNSYTFRLSHLISIVFSPESLVKKLNMINNKPINV